MDRRARGNPSSVSEKDIHLIAAGAESGARLLAAISREDGMQALYAELRRICDFQNYIVYVFRDGSRPFLFYTNLGMPRLQESMADYIKGLYALDPFYKLNSTGATGLFRMRDIMPDEFPKSEYYRHFYKYTNVVDELRYVVRPDSEQAIHVFVEREGAGNTFRQSDVDTFRALEPFVSEFVAAHVTWLDQHKTIQSAPAPRLDLRAKVAEMSPGTLTPREIETVELMLKGHATKSIAHELKIDKGTVANHKRHIYAKLEVHSQAQLFDLFLRSLN